MRQIIANRGWRNFRNWTVSVVQAKKSWLALLTLPALAGCSIHPVQRDVTGFRTVDIVDRIRCETRIAIQDKAIRLLRLQPSDQSKALAEQLNAARGQTWKLNPKNLSREEQDFYFRYIQTGIAYDFTFDITEDNKVAAVADPIKLITNGTVGIGIEGSSDFNRNNSRHFIMSDNFANLLSNNNLVCGSDYAPSNYAYPIAGSVGMFELIDTFIDLNEDKDLRPIDSGSARVFADTLTFLTTLDGSVTPHVTISPLGNRWGVAPPTNVAFSAQRMDRHKLIIGLSMEGTTAPRRSVLLSGPAFLGPAQGRSALQKNVAPGTPEQRALDAITQQRLDTFYDRFGTIQIR